MRFTSTRNKSLSVGFSKAVLECMPADGGLYVPLNTEDLRRWILYTDENTSWSSLAGTLTSAFINDEFSPIICETIATKAFKFAPEIRQLDEKLFLMELFNGPTGMHRDYGISYLASAIETIHQLKGGSSVFLDVSKGELGTSLAIALRGKKHVKAVIVYPKDAIRGIKESDFVWNGGNVWPVEVDGTEKQCHDMVREIFAERDFALDHGLTVANTANIGRLLPQAFFYPFAFSRIKQKVPADIFYSLAPGNYSNVVAGLYAWQFALPLNGFVIPSTDALSEDAMGNPVLLDSIVPLEKRYPADPAEPSNLERLEDVFSTNSLLMRHFVFPASLSEKQIDSAAKELFVKYKIYPDRHTASAYAACLAKKQNFDQDGSTVLIARDSPSLSEDFVRHTIGEVPPMKDSIKESLMKTRTGRSEIKDVCELKSIIQKL